MPYEHAYTAETLLAGQAMKIEETMWIAMRMLDEKKNLLQTLSIGKSNITAENIKERMEFTLVHIDRIRHIIMSHNKGMAGDLPN